MAEPKRTVDQRPDYQGFPKAGELIEITGTGSLSLHDRRVFNVLLEAAGSRLCDDVQHCIPIRDVRGSHKGKERVKDSVLKLMQTIVSVPVTGRNGKPATMYTQLLAGTTISDDDEDPTGEVLFAFPENLRTILSKSTHWGRLRGQIIFAFSSKYSLNLYELLCLRVNLAHKDSQVFAMGELRALLGVPEDKLTRNPDLLRYCIQPAVAEINGLSDFGVEVEPIRKGGTMRGIVTGFRVSWWRKSLPELHKAHAELARSKVGRLARLNGTAETVQAVQTDLADYLESLPR